MIRGLLPSWNWSSSPAIVLDQRLDVGAKLGPDLVRVVGLPVSVRHAAITLVLGIGEGHYDDVFDDTVGRLAVLEGAGGMECIPCCLVDYVGGKECVESGEGRVSRGVVLVVLSLEVGCLRSLALRSSPELG